MNDNVTGSHAAVILTDNFTKVTGAFGPQEAVLVCSSAHSPDVSNSSKYQLCSSDHINPHSQRKELLTFVRHQPKDGDSREKVGVPLQFKDSVIKTITAIIKTNSSQAWSHTKETQVQSQQQYGNGIAFSIFFLQAFHLCRSYK